jgi:PBSX family phage terminase large subunit
MSNGKVKFDKKWFNPLYFIIKKLLSEGVSEFYIYGGKSSAKTISVCQFIAVECLLKQRNALIFRKEQSTIKTTIKESAKLAIDMSRLSQGYNVMDFTIRSCYGNRITFKGIDNEEKAKGVEGCSYILWDELNQFEYAEYSQMILSFRGAIAKAFFGTWNPVSEDSWVKKELIDKDVWEDWDTMQLPSKHSFIRKNKQGNRVLIKTIYEDNYWTVGSPCGTYGYRDENLLAKYERKKEFDYDDYLINVLGEWGIIRPESLYIDGFNAKINTGNTAFNPREVILIGFDYNVGNSCVVGQMYEYAEGKWTIKILEEYHLSGGENNDLESLCEKLALKWGKFDIHYTGDASGNNGSALTQGSIGANTLVGNYLNKYVAKYYNHQRVYFKKFKSNPDTDYSGWICSFLFKILGKDFMIDESCSILIRDLNKAEKLAGGKLDKAKANKGDYGHVMDGMRYLIHAFCYDLWKKLSKDYDLPEHLKNQKQ